MHYLAQALEGRLTRLTEFRRRWKIALILSVDAGLIILALHTSMLLRLERLDFQASGPVGTALAFTTLTTLVAGWLLGLYRAITRFLTGKILVTVAKTALVSALTLLLTGRLLEAGIPRSVPVLFGATLFLLMGGVRFLARTALRRSELSQRRPVILYGAGEAGLQVLNSLFHGREYTPVGLVDDDPSLHGLVLSGLEVCGPTSLPELARSTRAEALLLAMPSLQRARRREIVESLAGVRIEIKTIPGMSEIISGQAKLSELRPVAPEDLLGRDPVTPIADLLERDLRGKSVLVTGAGGSIGSELCRQILRQEPRKLVLYENSEFSLYSIDSELCEKVLAPAAGTEIVAALGSVQDGARLEHILSTHGIETLYHAAAYKHVPLVEANPLEAIRNNVLGTLTVVSAAVEFGVSKVIMISTDKAVRPTNVMGATKRLAELICQGFAREPGPTSISMVRFGNVLGSSGSVIPRFSAQIEAGGPLTLTHEEVTRYFMTIPEASQLVIQAGAMGQGGEVFVLDMGDPVRILDLAKSMIRLHGLEPVMADAATTAPSRETIEIRVTGLRPGEKLYEELLVGNDPSPTQHSRIMMAKEAALPLHELLPEVESLRNSCERNDPSRALEILRALPLAFGPESGSSEKESNPQLLRAREDALPGTPESQAESQSIQAPTPTEPRPRGLSRAYTRLLHSWFLTKRSLTVGVRAVVRRPEDGAVLLVRHSYTPGWHFPGGGVEPGQTPWEAVQKELMEEAGLRLTAAPKLHGAYHNAGTSRRDHVLVYTCEVVAEPPQAKSLEIRECGYFRLDALPDAIDPGTRRRIEEIVHGRQATETW